MRLRPLNNRVVIQQDKADEKSLGGIVLPNEKKPMSGKVMAVGPGKLDQQGKRIPMTVKEGDHVMFDWGGNEVEIDRTKYYMMFDDNIMATILD